MTRRSLRRVLLGCGAVVLIVFLFRDNEERAYCKYSAYGLGWDQDSSQIERAHELLEKLDIEQDLFMRALHATDALSVLKRIVYEKPDFPLDQEFARFKTQTLNEFESDLVVPLKISAGYGEGPLMDAAFSWAEGKSDYFYDEIPKLFISSGQTNRARTVLLKAFERAKADARHPRCHHDYGISHHLGDLFDITVELGEIDLAYRFLPDLLMGNLGFNLEKQGSVGFPLTLAGIYTDLGRFEDAEYYYDLAYFHLLVEVAEREAKSKELLQFFREFLHPDMLFEAFWMTGQSIRIAKGYLELGERAKVEKILTFISENEIGTRLSPGWSNVTPIGRLYIELDRYEEADSIMQMEVTELLDSRISYLEKENLANIAQCYVDYGKEEKAQEIIERLVETIPVANVSERCFVAEISLELKLPHLVQGILSPIIEGGFYKSYWKEKYRLHGLLKLAKIYSQAGLVEETQGLLMEAETMFQNYADDTAELLRAYNDMAQIYIRLGMKDEALRLLEAEARALSILATEDLFNSYHAKLGTRYVELGEPTMAAIAFETALECYKTMEITDYARSEYLAKIAIGFFHIDDMEKGMRVLDMIHSLALEKEGSSKVSDLIGVSMLQANPKDPAAVAYWE